MKLDIGDRQFINGKPARVEGICRDEEGNIKQVFLQMDGYPIYDGYVSVKTVLDEYGQPMLPF